MGNAWNTDTQNLNRDRDTASKRIEDMVSLDEMIHRGSNDTVLVVSNTIFCQLVSSWDVLMVARLMACITT